MLHPFACAFPAFSSQPDQGTSQEILLLSLFASVQSSSELAAANAALFADQRYRSLITVTSAGIHGSQHDSLCMNPLASESCCTGFYRGGLAQAFNQKKRLL